LKTEGRICDHHGQLHYEIRGVEGMEPFLMTLASDSDHWMFVLSNGSLTAGRVNPEHALFPYYTQDKLLDMSGRSGSRTLVRSKSGTWEPLAPWVKDGEIRRTVRKNTLGTRIELEEEHTTQGLCYRLSWRPSERFGFVRRVEIENRGASAVELEILDGLLNILPEGLGQRFQNEFSILGDAYKQSELLEPEGLGIYHLSSVPTDLAEPMEALKASVAWQCGPGVEHYLLSQGSMEDFRAGKPVQPETKLRGRRGSYLAKRKFLLEPGESAGWYICADVAQDLKQIEELRAILAADASALEQEIEADCSATETRLREMLGNSDGFQCTGEKARCMRHTSNTLFNLMRGGALLTGYNLPVDDLAAHVAHFNRNAAARLGQILSGKYELRCGDPWDANHPLSLCGKDAIRLTREYLPLSFSRRHGDPSRPWNRFSIEIKEPDGSPRFYYQGNWRDIFQNWEALLQSYPDYFEAAICRFLNSSSADGYNPYRVTKDGFEWEIPEPGDPWANIGYWGDHQIIYLLRLLENSVCYHPGSLAGLLDDEAFVYAEIPYRIRPFKEVLANPRDTVVYDRDWEERISERIKETGADGKLMHTPSGELYYVSLMEKLLAPLLAKLSNYVPGGGIWMNTQRPEWNDANNALVGFGVSAVTLGYVARYLRFLLSEFGDALDSGSFNLSCELVDLIKGQADVFSKAPTDLDNPNRQSLMQQLGEPASAFRAILYAGGLSGRKDSVKGSSIRDYLEAALQHVEFSLRHNKREDGLWHSYNLLDIKPDGVGLQHLFVMLEGQVSILSSGTLGVDEALDLLRALRKSDLYREDQDSYLLYPDRTMADFLDKNRIPAEEVDKIPLLKQMLQANDSRIIRKIPTGEACFNGSFHNAGDLEKALGKIDQAADADKKAVLELFESSFNHHAFTGRSGTFFAYEGLGSIYWHMVSKLALAVQENYIQFHDEASPDAARELLERFREIRDGLGVNKNPGLYGAFPTDAYSHTPGHAGAQQPGMTGQVKEDILIRLNELGVRVGNGCLSFDPQMIESCELLADEERYQAMDQQAAMLLPEGAMAFSFCGIPVIYQQGKQDGQMSVQLDDGSVAKFDSRAMPADLSREIFQRSGKVRRIEIAL
jgi:hypothetical protein